uniref:hypothetical protein n=1 Tax=Elioraea sp. TaxID=2185103 RepID=UPI003F6E71DB
KSELARYWDVTKARVSQYIARGMPVLPDGRVDLAEAEMWRAENVDTSRGTDVDGAAAERARLLRAQAERAELDLAARRGELVERSLIAATLVPRIRELRDTLLGIPRDTVRDDGDAAVCEGAIAAALDQFANRLTAMAGGHGNV